MSLRHAARRMLAPGMAVQCALASSAAPALAHQAGLSTSAASAWSSPVESQPDPFTRSLQAKTEEGLLQLLAKQRQQALEAQEQEHPDAGGSPGDDTHPDTGEQGGYRGKEPTRFGDWEHKGRCTDFE